MKKLVAVVLSMIMMFAVCVPAFAADPVSPVASDIQITDDSPEVVDGKQTEDSILKTSTQKKDGTEGATYTVTIPAETIIPWEETLQLFTYNVKTQLASGKRLTVEVASAKGSTSEGENTLTKADSADVLPYTFSLTNGGASVASMSYTTEDEVVNTNRTFNINIKTADWQSVPVAEYTDTLTFTVAVVDAAAVGQEA